MPRPIMANADLQRILQADEIKAALRPRRAATKKTSVKKNPLKDSVCKSWSTHIQFDKLRESINKYVHYIQKNT